MLKHEALSSTSPRAADERKKTEPAFDHGMDRDSTMIEMTVSPLARARVSFGRLGVGCKPIFDTHN